MSDPTAQEPTMEEILASIRRIISEDDAPAADPEHAADAAPAGGDPAPHEAEAPPHEEVLELTQRVEPPHEPSPPVADHSLGDLDVFTAPEPKAAEPETPSKAKPVAEPASWEAAGAEVDEEEPLMADHKAEAAATHFGSLAKSLTMPAAGRTLEDVVREMLRPLLKEWLDSHLQQIVEVRVQDEVERISRRRVH